MTRSFIPAARTAFAPLALAMAIGSAAPSRPAQAGAWPQEEDHGQVITGMQGYQARNQGFDRFGRPDGFGRTNQLDGSVYWEHGVTSRWTVGLAPRLQALWVNDTNADHRNFGLAETKAFARYTLMRGDWDTLAIQGQVGTPGLRQGSSPRIAEPNASYELRMLYGRSFPLPQNMSGFIDLQAAFNYRSGAAADEQLYQVTAGLRFMPEWMALLQFASTIGLRDGGSLGADYSVHRFYASVVHDISPRWSVQLGYMKEVAGRRVPLGQGVVGALWYRY